jgi:hypothetical protein
MVAQGSLQFRVLGKRAEDNPDNVICEKKNSLKQFLGRIPSV